VSPCVPVCCPFWTMVERNKTCQKAASTGMQGAGNRNELTFSEVDYSRRNKHNGH
jgi:hypothetical protein